MVTKPIACKLYSKLASAPAEWFKTEEGKRLAAKSIALVKEKEGEEEAKTLENLLIVCAATLI